LLDIGEERRSVHRAVDAIGCRHPIDAQGCYQRWVFPVPVRHAGDKTLAARGTPVVPDHLRRDPGLVDEDETRRIELGLLGSEGGALGSNVWTILLGGVFFEGDVVTIKEAADRADADFLLLLQAQSRADLLKMRRSQLPSERAKFHCGAGDVILASPVASQVE